MGDMAEVLRSTLHPNILTNTSLLKKANFSEQNKLIKKIEPGLVFS